MEPVVRKEQSFVDVAPIAVDRRIVVAPSCQTQQDRLANHSLAACRTYT